MMSDKKIGGAGLRGQNIETLTTIRKA